MAEEEEVTAPDQHRPGHRRAGQAGAVISIGLLVAMAFLGNRDGGPIVWWLIGTAVILLLMLIGDWLLRRSGLRS